MIEFDPVYSKLHNLSSNFYRKFYHFIIFIPLLTISYSRNKIYITTPTFASVYTRIKYQVHKLMCIKAAFTKPRVYSLVATLFYNLYRGFLKMLFICYFFF